MASSSLTKSPVTEPCEVCSSDQQFVCASVFCVDAARNCVNDAACLTRRWKEELTMWDR